MATVEEPLSKIIALGGAPGISMIAGLLFTILMGVALLWTLWSTRGTKQARVRAALRREFFDLTGMRRPQAEIALRSALASVRRRHPGRTLMWQLEHVVIESRRAMGRPNH